MDDKTQYRETPHRAYDELNGVVKFWWWERLWWRMQRMGYFVLFALSVLLWCLVYVAEETFKVAQHRGRHRRFPP